MKKEKKIYTSPTFYIRRFEIESLLGTESVPVDPNATGPSDAKRYTPIIDDEEGL